MLGGGITLQVQIMTDFQSARFALLTHFNESRYLPTALRHNVWQLSCTVIFPEYLSHSLIDVLRVLTLLDSQGLPVFGYQLPETGPGLLAWLPSPDLMDLFSLSLTWVTLIPWFFLI